ncbi:FecCD family ABC transporter permease [Cohnella sp. GCM10020058]|uniref:FecCD family ABC transporter permease n=1 Tax=Cohnella sp. GCM10020058 TaxID=3317330 RepID=UPI003625AE14
MAAKSIYAASDTKRRAKAWSTVVGLALLVVVVFVISMNTGYIRLSPLDVGKTLLGFGTDKQALILFQFRLPRIVISVLVGAGFALAGCILQGITRNPLADPGLIGVNAGASLMVIMFVALRPSISAAPPYTLPFLAFFGAAAAGATVYFLAYKKSDGVSVMRLILVGIAVQAGISAAIIVLTMRLNPEQYQFAATWLAGSLWGANWKFVLTLLPWMAIFIPFVLSKARTLNVLSLGDHLSVGLGARLQRERLLLLLAAVALAGSCVAVGGAISFIGLIGPHLARRLVGSRHEILLAASALSGSVLLIAADTISRISDTPTGIIVAIIGAPYFIYLLARAR